MVLPILVDLPELAFAQRHMYASLTLLITIDYATVEKPYA